MGRFRLSFTTGGLLVSEIAIACQRILDARSISEVRKDLEAERVFAGRTTRAVQRLTQEVVDRAATLTPDEQQLAREGSAEDRQNLAWLAATRRYAILAVFARDVLREKFITLDLNLSIDDFDRFWIAQSQWHPEVEATTDSTKQKLRQNLFKMLRQADYLTADNTIESAYLSPTFIEAIHPNSPQDLDIFPIHTATALELIAR